ncbi:unnamed protein product [Rotaria sordida]|uniref:Ionotropic glutamate receptor C-terminal domain-containing protein n=2 Tax=Rotaria sordida TaxID=392033 RepID=A0A814Q171_9BILA|nr:unnamed protein product [Rotaria sordida]CAF1113035.1 unnamed protein product [Rotaria sordida]
MFKAAVLLSHQYNITIDGEFLGWQVAETTGGIIDALSDACRAVLNLNTVGIIGPELSRESQLVAPFGEKLGIPVISYASTDPDLSDKKTYPTFYRTVPSDDTAASSLVKLFIRYNWTSCSIIYQNDAFGSGGVKAINQAFNQSKLTVTQTVIFDIGYLGFRGDLKVSLVNSPTRIVIVWAESIYTSIILQKALDLNLVGPSFTWILSSSVSFDSFNKTFQENLIGMLLIEPVVGSVVNVPINQTLLDSALNIWQQYENETYPRSTNVDYYALFAFDATWALIQSLQKLCSSTINNSSSCLSFVKSSFCFDNRFNQSNLLLDALSTTQFLGVSGPVQFTSNSTNRINGSYYSLKNLHSVASGLSFVSVLEYVDPGNWRTPLKENVIIWPGNTLTSPSSRALLKGVTLRIGIIRGPPFLIVENITDNTGQTIIQYNGYIWNLLNLLKDKIGFNPIIQLAPSNQTYTQIVQSVNDGAYDIVVGDVTVTSNRRELVGFSNAIFDNSLRIIMRKSPDISVDLLSFLKPFSRNLWILVFATFIYAGILMCIIERKDNKGLESGSILSQFVLSVWYCFGNIVGYGVEFNARTAAGRFLTAGLYILSLILVASYTANLASDLTIAKSQGVISGIDDIKNKKIPNNRIGIRVGTASEDYYLSEISGGNKNYHPLYTRQQMYDELLAGTIEVSFLDDGIAQYVTNDIYCNLTLAGNGFDVGIFGIVTPKQWLYAQDLDVNILSLRETGQLEDLRQKWFEQKHCSDSTVTSTAIEIKAISGLFVTFAVISVLSFLLFLWMKRLMIKGYLSKFICPNKSSTEQKYSIKRRGSKTSQHSQNNQTVLPNFSGF